MRHKPSHAKFQHFQNWGLMKGVENVRFSTENWPYLGNSER